MLAPHESGKSPFGNPKNHISAKVVLGVGRQAIEGNPLTPDEIAMFEMFEHEGWSPERRRAHILSLGKPKRVAASA
jgi:hypothetical protein